MVVQCVARKIPGLPVTLLEINTVMHVICALLMYLLWLHKPLDVSIPVTITSQQINSNGQIKQRIKKLLCGAILNNECVRDENNCALMHQHSGYKREYTIHRAQVGQGKSNVGDGAQVDWEKSNVRDGVGLYLGILSSWIYGGVHLTPWSSHLPTVLERILWRASGLIIICAPAVAVLATHVPVVGAIVKKNRIKSLSGAWKELFGFAQSGKWGKFRLMLPYFVLMLLCGLLYASARVYCVIEAFASLRSLPVGSYTSVNWVEMFPHL